MTRNILAFIALTVSMTGCVVAPKTDTPRPWFTASTDLGAKADGHNTSTWAQVNNDGLLLYDARLPFDEGDNYARSHDIADGPAWHGVLMAATAFEGATTGRDVNDKLTVLANGIINMWSITGEEGFYARSAYRYSGSRLEWMDTPEDRPTKHWRQSPNGWFRTGAAKGHLTRAVYGAGVALALHKKGELSLNADTVDSLKKIVVASVRRLADNGYFMIGWDGEPTEFGDLSPSVVPKEYIDLVRPFISILPWNITEEDLDKLTQPVNGFNMILVLSMLRAAGEYDEEMMGLYESELAKWSKNLKLSLKLLGFVISRIGHYRLDKPSYSDMELVSQAATLLYLYEGDSPATEVVGDGLKGMWSFVQYERNVPYILAYSLYHPNDVSHQLVEALEDLRAFPDAPKMAHGTTTEETASTQPLANRKMSSHYWKSDPSEKVVGTPVPQPGRFYGGQDYLMAYWFGRYLRLVPEN
jgi:hypothetical protein